MPANLPPGYLEAEGRYRKAKTAAAKIEALEQMLALIPKHKGTDKLQADIKRRLSKARQEPKKKTARRTFSYIVEKEGAAQVFIVGPPNVGKSSLVVETTNAAPEVADYPYTTRKPTPGMMRFEDIGIQLVDTPPIGREHTELWLASIIRYADLVLLMADLSSDDLLDRLEDVITYLEDKKLYLLAEIPAERPDDLSVVQVRTLLVANKLDADGARDNLEILEEFFGERFAVCPVSLKTGEGMVELQRAVFDALEILRIYTKIPGKPPDLEDPYVVPRGTTLQKFAAHVHKEIGDQLRFARVWGGDNFDGRRVNRDYELQDKLVVELHT